MRDEAMQNKTPQELFSCGVLNFINFALVLLSFPSSSGPLLSARPFTVKLD